MEKNAFSGIPTQVHHHFSGLRFLPVSPPGSCPKYVHFLSFPIFLYKILLLIHLLFLILALLHPLHVCYQLLISKINKDSFFFTVDITATSSTPLPVLPTPSTMQTVYLIIVITLGAMSTILVFFLILSGGKIIILKIHSRRKSLCYYMYTHP